MMLIPLEFTKIKSIKLNGVPAVLKPISSNYSFKPYIKQNNIWCNGKISYGPIRTFYRHVPFCWTYGK